MNKDQKSDVYAQEKQDFIQYFSHMVKVLSEDEMGHPETGDAIAQLEAVLEYDAIGGKYNQGLTVLVAFWELVEPRKQNAHRLQRALTVDWYVELLQAFFLVSDDIMDSSLRFGLDAINNTLLPEACILLKFYCWEQTCYLNLNDLFLHSSYQTEIGQILDLITVPQDNVDLGRYTGKEVQIVSYKRALYSFYLPSTAAMYMASIDGEKEHANMPIPRRS